MSQRLALFRSYASHPWLKKGFQKLSISEIFLASSFIEQKDHLPVDQFEFAINRMFLDKADKPKNWVIIMEMLANANTQAYNASKPRSPQA